MNRQVQALLKFVEDTSGAPKYQDIEIAGEKVLNGYTPSTEDWAVIRKFLPSWKGLRVCDVGCFNGYFSFKAEEVGALVIGFDCDGRTIEIARRIAKIRGSITHFMSRTVGEDKPFFLHPCNVVLAMNMMHYLDADVETAFLREVFNSTTHAIFEVNSNQREQIGRLAVEAGFQEVRVHQSQREGTDGPGSHRFILHYTKEG